jgi:outer membrane biosynthesis protein TonB
MSIPRDRARSFLAYGFGISIAVHLIVLPFVRPQPTVAGDEIVDHFRVDHMPTPPPTPPPTPTPKPTVPTTPPPHATTPQPQPRAILIRAQHQDTHPHTGNGEPANRHTVGDPNGDPNARGTAAPVATGAPATPAAAAMPAATPRPTPTPLSCARPNVTATTLHPVAPDTPAMAQTQGISGIVQVVVSLDAQSRVVGTRVQTSPSVLLNQAALAAARESQFRTEIRNCEPVAADYIFSVEFTSQ